MKSNMGGLDRALRIIIGLALLALGIFVVKPVGWMVVFIVVGAVLFLTAVVGFCPLYVPLKINTSSSEAGEKEKAQP